jgi:hypothetical protein
LCGVSVPFKLIRERDRFSCPESLMHDQMPWGTKLIDSIWLVSPFSILVALLWLVLITTQLLVRITKKWWFHGW